jgi:hypothetical protein
LNSRQTPFIFKPTLLRRGDGVRAIASGIENIDPVTGSYGSDPQPVTFVRPAIGRKWFIFLL